MQAALLTNNQPKEKEKIMSFTIAVTGGQGFEGRMIVQTLVARNNADRVIAIDMFKSGELEGAEELIGDIHDHDALVELLKDVDLVFNAVGPYFAHGTAVADAALASGTHYADLCADIEITRALIAKDKQWQEAGLTAVTGFGMSPGLTNLLAAKLAARLDEMQQVSMFWWGSIGDEVVPSDMRGTLEGLLNEEFGPVTTFEDGKEITVNGFRDGAEELDVMGHKLTFFHAGHSEQITMPLYFPVEQAHLKGCVLPNGVTQLIDAGVKIGMKSKDEIDVYGVKMKPFDFLINYAFNKNTYAEQCDLDSLNAPEGVCARVVGLRDGKQVTLTEGIALGERSGNCEGMLMTGVSAAVCAEGVVNGLISRRGVYAPEALDADTAVKLIDASNDQFSAMNLGRVRKFN